MTTNDLLFLDDFNPKSIAKKIAARVRKRRLEINLTQEALASRSGFSVGTLKRFEATGDISLMHLLSIAVVLSATDEFKNLFTVRKYESIQQVIDINKSKERKRGRKK